MLICLNTEPSLKLWMQGKPNKGNSNIHNPCLRGELQDLILQLKQTLATTSFLGKPESFINEVIYNIKEYSPSDFEEMTVLQELIRFMKEELSRKPES